MKIKPFDIVIIFVLFGLSFLMIFHKPKGSKKLVLMINEKRVVFPLENKVINLKKEYGKNVVIKIEKERAKIVESDCPLKICVKSGWISRCGDFAICVPNKVAIFMDCEQKEYDAISK